MADSNNRKYYRVADKVSLKISTIDKQKFNASELLEQKKKKTGLANQFIHERRTNRPNLLSIEKRFPEVANYIEYLEDKIQLLADGTGSEQSDLSSDPTHTVNLSASGISFDSDKTYQEDSLVELSIRLFPSRCTIHSISSITRCNLDKNRNKIHIAAKFTHISEEDKEILFKHIHDVQISSLKMVAN